MKLTRIVTAVACTVTMFLSGCDTTTIPTPPGDVTSSTVAPGDETTVEDTDPSTVAGDTDTSVTSSTQSSANTKGTSGKPSRDSGRVAATNHPNVGVFEELPKDKNKALTGTLVDLPVDNEYSLVQHDGDDSFYQENGHAQVKKKLAPQEVQYGKLDSRGRSTGVYAMVTLDMYNHSKGVRLDRERGLEPSGYKGNNKKVKVSDMVLVDGFGKSVEYNGYFYNRSHLLGDLLGGRFFVNNLITGTRMQNVGWNHKTGTPDGGMQYTENLARRHFEKLNKENENLPAGEKKQCDVYYAAVPNYEGTDLVPKSVTVDIQTCDKSIDKHVIVMNYAPGYKIDYKTGTFTEEK